MLARDAFAEDEVMDRDRMDQLCHDFYLTEHHDEGHRRFSFSGRYIRIWSQVRQLWRPGSWDFGE